MKYIIILTLLFTNILFPKSAFIKMCENPTSSQKATLEAIVSKNKFLFKTEDFDEVICDKIENLLKNRGYIRLDNPKVVDITPIQYFPHLTSVYIDDESNVSDLTPLLKLTNLKELSIIDNPIKDISILKNFPKLTSLTLNSEDLKDISLIKYFVNLDYLYLSSIQNLDFKYIESSQKLTMMTISYSNIKNLCSLNKLIKLEKLKLSDANINDISCLTNLKNINNLDLGTNNITNLSSIKNFSCLIYLQLFQNPVSDLSPLLELRHLKWLGLDSTKVDDISLLKPLLPRLKKVRLGITEVKRCSPKNIQELRDGKSCLNKDGTSKVFWKQWLGI